MSEHSRAMNGAAVVTPVTGKKQKMPIGRPFKKGRSGNPTGRPKGTKTVDIRELAKQYGPATIDILFSIAQNGRAPSAARVSAAVALLDRGFGKPTQPIGGDETVPPVAISAEERRAEAAALVREAFAEVVSRRAAAVAEPPALAASPIIEPIAPPEKEGKLVNGPHSQSHAGALVPLRPEKSFARRHGRRLNPGY